MSMSALQEQASRYAEIRNRLRGPTKRQIIPIKSHDETVLIEVETKTKIHCPPVVKVARKYPMLSDIMRVVCQFYAIGKYDIRSASRRQEIVRPRFMMMYLQKTMTAEGYISIGRFCGDRDHTTALNAVRVITKELETNDKMKAELDLLKGMIADVMAQRYLAPNEPDANGNHQ